MNRPPPCVLHEDDHLLVVNKPPGWNTHAPSPYAGEGIYDWLRHREPRWARLAIIHRLDKETSGVLVFARTPLANRSLTEQFTQRAVRKRYVLLTDRPAPKTEWREQSNIVRAGDRYVSQRSPGGERAETWFKVLQAEGPRTRIEVEPKTGRTHQIRVHAAASGVPILGDTGYGGSPFARVCLHAEEISFQHPSTGVAVTFVVPADFSVDPAILLRAGIVDPGETDCYRLVHGPSDAEPGWWVDKLGEYLLVQSDGPLDDVRRERLSELVSQQGARGAYHKRLTRQVRQAMPAEVSARLVLGGAAPRWFTVRENGLAFELSFAEGCSVGLFLDQRDNRRRFLTGHIAAGFPLGNPVANRESQIENDQSLPTAVAGEMLNVFAYTCGFSVCAAQAGSRTTSLDLSKKNLARGRRNFELNRIDPAMHDFIFGDAFDWLRRLAKKGRAFDSIVLDPPTFSQSKASGVFRAEKDYGRLVTAALPLLKPGGVILTSTNSAELGPEAFLEVVAVAIQRSGRKVAQQFYAPQPPDFPVSRAEPAYLKTCWWRIA